MAFKFDMGLHKTQLQVYNDPHKHKVIAAGKGWGKTNLVTKCGAAFALTKPGTSGAVIAPYAKQANFDFEAIKRLIPADKVKKTSERWMSMNLRNGSDIMMGSADNIVGLRGFAWDWVIVDEAAWCDPEVFYVIDSQIGKRNGIGWYISTPWGKGIFYELYCRELKDKDFKSFHFTTHDNPYYPVTEIERMKINMPEAMYKQEVLAQFLEGGLVFPHLKEIMTAVPRQPIPGHQYVTGVDLAKVVDFTVIKTFDMGDNNEVSTERFTQRDWSFVKTAIYTHCKRYNNSALIIDATGVGASVVEDLQKMDRAYPGAKEEGHLVVIPVVFSGKFKPVYYSNYIMAHDNRTIRLIPDPVTKQEHEDLLSTKTANTVQYSAPKGKHEDTVTAAVLAVWGLEKICGGSAVIGGTDEQLLPHGKKKPIDLSTQLDIEGMIRASETKQILGHGYNYEQDDLNIFADYAE